MRTLEAILATIGAWCVLCTTIVAIWILTDRRIHKRRGGLLDLTPPADARKNARGAS